MAPNEVSPSLHIDTVAALSAGKHVSSSVRPINGRGRRTSRWALRLLTHYDSLTLDLNWSWSYTLSVTFILFGWICSCDWLVKSFFVLWKEVIGRIRQERPLDFLVHLSRRHKQGVDVLRTRMQQASWQQPETKQGTMHLQWVGARSQQHLRCTASKRHLDLVGLCKAWHFLLRCTLYLYLKTCIHLRKKCHLCQMGWFLFLLCI